jgi:hypothetical protein
LHSSPGGALQRKGKCKPLNNKEDQCEENMIIKPH